jgi:hypothetical protein
MESVLPFVLLGLAVGLLIWGVNNLSAEGRYTKLFPISATAVGVALLGWFFTTYGNDGTLYAVFLALLLSPCALVPRENHERWSSRHSKVGTRVGITFTSL